METIKSQLNKLGLGRPSKLESKNKDSSIKKLPNTKKPSIEILSGILLSKGPLSQLKNSLKDLKIHPSNIEIDAFIEIYKRCVFDDFFDFVELGDWLENLDVERAEKRYIGKKSLISSLKRAATKAGVSYYPKVQTTSKNIKRDTRSRKHNTEKTPSTTIKTSDIILNLDPFDMLLERGKLVFDNQKTKWKISGFTVSSNKITVNIEKLDRRKTVDIHNIRTEAGIALVPGNSYLMYIGNEGSRFLISFKKVSKHKCKEIQIIGDPESKRIVKNQKLCDFKLNIPCFTNKPFDEAPDDVVISIGDRVAMRKDWAADYYYGSIEYQDKEGVVTSIESGIQGFSNTNTIAIEFDGVKKRYSLHRVVDSKGNAFCLGWRYRVIRDGVVLKAVATRPIEIDRVSFSNC